MNDSTRADSPRQARSVQNAQPARDSLPRWWSWLLYAAGVWNLSAAAGMFRLDLQARLFFGERFHFDDAEPVPAFYARVALLSIGLFGLGYLAVGRRPLENRAIVGLGLLGKVVGFFLLLWLWRIGAADLSVALIGVGDLLFGLGFAAYLVQSAPYARRRRALLQSG